MVCDDRLLHRDTQHVLKFQKSASRRLEIRILIEDLRVFWQFWSFDFCTLVKAFGTTIGLKHNVSLCGELCCGLGKMVQKSPAVGSI
jgi:hypothetical protein